MGNLGLPQLQLIKTGALTPSQTQKIFFSGGPDEENPMKILKVLMAKMHPIQNTDMCTIRNMSNKSLFRIHLLHVSRFGVLYLYLPLILAVFALIYENENFVWISVFFLTAFFTQCSVPSKFNLYVIVMILGFEYSLVIVQKQCLRCLRTCVIYTQLLEENESIKEQTRSRVLHI